MTITIWLWHAAKNYLALQRKQSNWLPFTRVQNRSSPIGSKKQNKWKQVDKPASVTRAKVGGMTYLLHFILQQTMVLVKPRRAGGCFEQPSSFSFFFADISTTAGPSTDIFGTPVYTSFPHMCDNFRPRSLKVRSPGRVKFPRLRKSLNARYSYTETPDHFEKNIRKTVQKITLCSY